MTTIEWVQNSDGTQGKSWNPITGCTRTSPGCAMCYAERMTKRLAAMGQPKYQGLLNGNGRFNGIIKFWPDALEIPLRTKKPTVWFVNSMSDLLHVNVKFDWLDAIFDVMSRTPQHTYQILTKRAELLPQRIGAMVDGYGILPNVWLGVSVETSDYKGRIEYLRRTPSAIRFLSLEPLLADLGELDLTGIHWVIVGGESGPGAREFKMEWAGSIVQQCKNAGVPVFVKQMGDNPTWDNEPVRNLGPKGKNVSRWPKYLQVREFPKQPKGTNNAKTKWSQT